MKRKQGPESDSALAMSAAIPSVKWGFRKKRRRADLGGKARRFVRDVQMGLGAGALLFVGGLAWHVSTRELGFQTDEAAVRHLASMAGCGAGAVLGAGPAKMGEHNYWRHNDLDADGTSCEEGLEAPKRRAVYAAQADPAPEPLAPLPEDVTATAAEPPLP